MRNSSVYPKSTPEEARFPLIGSRAILNSPPNTTNGLTSFRQLHRFPENTVPSLEEHQIQHRNSRKAPCTPNRLKMRADSLASTQEVCELSTSPQQEPSLSNRYVGGTQSLLSQVEWTKRGPDSKEGGISLQ